MHAPLATSIHPPPHLRGERRARLVWLPLHTPPAGSQAKAKHPRKPESNAEPQRPLLGKGEPGSRPPGLGSPSQGPRGVLPSAGLSWELGPCRPGMSLHSLGCTASRGKEGPLGYPTCARLSVPVLRASPDCFLRRILLGPSA